ncbi:A1 family peptidase [Shewanella avicenniae]|uniref:A1 family peptidase n=1 Tax=Shewanella avicenniae TaxID=2814294 RepID=A0ABX7QU23_9GAMM|nr:pepsin-like aspartic protease [Shewanella avicenniae]QSX34495.1 A1 family peptidase [Shewanella avicenniae]
MKASPDSTVIKLPLLNTLAQGGYTAAMRLGSQQQEVRLVIDSGSSTLAVHHSKYQAEHDQHLQPTSLAQEILYGVGGWMGPVIHTEIALGSAKLSQTAVALVQEEASQTFAEADGILGLAYAPLNRSYDFSGYLTSQGTAPPNTYPWPFPSQSHATDKDLAAFKKLQQHATETDLPSTFDALAQQGVCANRFSLVCQRSSIHIDPNYAHPSHDPLNQGWLLLGGGAEQTQHYQGEFHTLKVLHDRYYNVDLIGLNLVGQATIKVTPSDSLLIIAGSSNAIIDTGASLISLPADAFTQLMTQFAQAVTNATELLAPFCGDVTKVIAAQQQGIDAQQLNLADWPAIEFHFQGQNGAPLTLSCAAQHYWQLNSPAHGKAVFKLMGQLPNWTPQSIIGLPLLSAYYVIFERDDTANGTVRFAAPRGR